MIAWVDGGDPAWRKEKAKYSGVGTVDDSEERYRDFDLLRYWFRGVEKYAPWVRKIHFVTWGHLPSWLDTSHPKLHIVRHEDYMPKEILPTFNSSTIEMYFNRIEGLSENFVYFNDDMFPIRKCVPEDFFVDGKPCDMLAFQPVVANPKNPVMTHIFMNDALILSKHFNKRENVRKHPGDYFKLGYPPLYFFYNFLELGFPLYSGFFTPHGPAPLCKSMYELIWQEEGETLYKATTKKFRCDTDVNQYLIRNWKMLLGEFHAKNILKDLGYFEVGKNQEKLISTIKKQKCRLLCLNDAQVQGDVEKLKTEIQDAFASIFPEFSAFEKQN